MRHLGYRIFMCGQVISLLGTWIQGTAQRWLVLEITGSSFYVGILGAVAGLPLLFFSLVGGILADRFPRIRFLLFVHLLIFIQAVVFGGLVQTRHIDFYTIVFLALLLGIGMSFEVPARQSLVFDLVGRADITNGIAIHSTAFNLARFAGPAVAGLMIQAGLMADCFYFKAFSALAVMTTLLVIKRKYSGLDTPSGGNKSVSKPIKAVKEVLEFVCSRKDLFRIFLTIISFGILLLPYSILLPSFSRDLLSLNADGYGFISAANGFGALIGAIFVASFGHFDNRKRWWRLGALLFPVSLIVFAFSLNYVQACIFLFISGFIMVITSTSAISILQIEAKDDLRGRMMGLFTTSFMGLFPFGSVIQGYLADLIGIRQTLLATATLAFFISLFLNKR